MSGQTTAGASRARFSLSPTGLPWQATMTVASALLLLLAFPPFELHYLAWVALVPLLAVIDSGVTARRAFCLGWLFGLEFTFFAENWIAHSMTHFGEMLTVVAYGVALLFAAILALFPALFAGVMATLARRWGSAALVAAPVVWVGTEWLRPQVTGVTWNALGVTQYKHFAVAKLAQTGGVYLVSAELVAASVLLTLLPKLRQAKVGKAIAGLVVVAVLAFLVADSQRPASNAGGATVSVLGVQPNLPPASTETARDLENNLRLTREAIQRTPDKAADLVVWAESPLALFYETDSLVRNQLDQLAVELHSHLLVNAVTRAGERYFNSLQVVSPYPQNEPKPLRRYDKIRLVPFGEYVPFNAVLKHVVPRVISSEAGGFAAGREAVVNSLRLEARVAISLDKDAAIERTTNYVRVGGFICYEAAYPDLVRQFTRNGATLLVNVSNDAWFGTTAGARQHLAHAVMRAIENDRDLIRVTNSGISALITADGRIVDSLPPFAPGAQLWQAQSRRSQTFYVRYGDGFAIGCAILSLALLLLSLARRRGGK